MKIDYADEAIVLSLIDDILQSDWVKGKVLQRYLGSDDVARVAAIRSVIEQYYMAMIERGSSEDV